MTYGSLTSATNVPIATAAEGSKYATYNAGTTYVRYDIIANASKVYQAIIKTLVQVKVLLLILAVTLAGGDISLPRQQSRRDWLALHRKIST